MKKYITSTIIISGFIGFVTYATMQTLPVESEPLSAIVETTLPPLEAEVLSSVTVPAVFVPTVKVASQPNPSLTSTSTVPVVPPQVPAPIVVVPKIEDTSETENTVSKNYYDDDEEGDEEDEDEDEGEDDD